jgi:predicted KAP-like P-loop ATPase
LDGIRFILQVLFKYHDDAKVERDEHEKEMLYYDKLMDLILNHINEEFPMEWDEIFNHVQNQYHEHREKYENFCSTISSLQLNIEILLSYREIIE